MACSSLCHFRRISSNFTLQTCISSQMGLVGGTRSVLDWEAPLRRALYKTSFAVHSYISEVKTPMGAGRRDALYLGQLVGELQEKQGGFHMKICADLTLELNGLYLQRKTLSWPVYMCCLETHGSEQSSVMDVWSALQTHHQCYTVGQSWPVRLLITLSLHSVATVWLVAPCF